ncbi:hypothetical protein SHL15_3912 [Streptomyces hygroscopicus subsp. limoneus]|nr:hypothetical protein SHL15_3912 [Streptomyces hygroscopicus subsp. limoneus]
MNTAPRGALENRESGWTGDVQTVRAGQNQTGGTELPVVVHEPGRPR